MNTSKEVKVFHSHDAQIAISAKRVEAKKLSESIKLIREATGLKGTPTLASFNEWLCAEAGFKSPSFSAKSMDLEQVYTRVHNLVKGLTITIDDLTPMHQLKQSFIDAINESFTVYYTEQELKDLNTLRKAKELFDSLPYNLRTRSLVNREFKLYNQSIM